MIFAKKIINAYKKRLILRYEELDTVKYFTYKDFLNLKCESFSFLGNNKQRLNGAFYFYGDKNTERVIVFEHGLSAGHQSYMKEIEILAKNGYTVFSYDHTGCVSSEGENIRAFSQSISDLDACINALKETYPDIKISVIGHSWGGLSTLNIGAIHKDITHVVGISAPISVRQMFSQIFKGLLRCCLNTVMVYEKANNPLYAELNAVHSLAKTQAKVLVMHSDDDKVVSYNNFLILQEALKERKDTEFFKMTGKNHNPNYTKRAVEYKKEFFKDLNKKIKNHALESELDKKNFKDSYDFDLMTEQDSSVWNKILEFLKA